MAVHRLIASLALALTLVGCAFNTTTFDRGGFALAYADMKAAYASAYVRLSTACQSKKLDKETCAALADGHRQVEMVEVQIRKAIANPQATIDWEQVATYMQLAIKVAALL